jgi:putative ABC transport system permease protein
MIRNYFLTAIRNILRYKGFSFINILGLSIGIAATLLILLWVQDELSFDKFHKHADRLYQVEEDQYYSGEVYHVTVTPYPSGPVWREEIPEIENACRYQWSFGMLFNYGEKAFYEDNCLAVDSTFFSMFSFPLIKGNPYQLLREPFTAVLTEKAAEKYFGNEDAIGKSLNVNNQYEFTVTGMIEDPPGNSTLQFDILIPFDFLKEKGQYNDHWGSNSIRTYVLLDENAVLDSVNSKLTRVVRSNVETTTDFSVFPFTRVHLHQYFGYGHPTTAVIFVYIFSIIAGFVLIIACINFMNLSTAKSSTRAREIGMRKAVGGNRRNLVTQFLGESFLLTLLSMIIALIIISLILPVFNQIAGKELIFKDLLNAKFIVGLVVLTILTAFIAGLYPSLFLSSFKTVNILKGESVTGRGSGILRKVLVVFQFTLSIFLIIGTIVIYKQLIYIRNIDLGFDKEHVFYIYMRGEIGKNYETLKEEFSKHPQVKSVSATLHSPTHIGSNSGGADWDGKDPEMRVLIGYSAIDYDYIETMGIEIVAGRSFSRDYPSDRITDSTAAFLVNEEVVRIMGTDDPVGQRFDFAGRKGTIVGVMKNFHYHSARNKIEPLAIHCRKGEELSALVVKMGPGDITKSMDELEKTWHEILPIYPFDYIFLDQDYDRMYRTEARMGDIIKYFTILGIIIACLGLFGLASFTAERKTQEIGVRKVVGASVSAIISLLSREFTYLVVFSCIIAVPVAYFVMKMFLNEFAFHTNLNWWIFALACLAALIIANLTVSFQAARAALTNPAEALRYE